MEKKKYILPCILTEQLEVESELLTESDIYHGELGIREFNPLDTAIDASDSPEDMSSLKQIMGFIDF